MEIPQNTPPSYLRVINSNKYPSLVFKSNYSENAPLSYLLKYPSLVFKSISWNTPVLYFVVILKIPPLVFKCDIYRKCAPPFANILVHTRNAPNLFRCHDILLQMKNMSIRSDNSCGAIYKISKTFELSEMSNMPKKMNGIDWNKIRTRQRQYFELVGNLP